MKVTAIICEYNPFHNGHKKQLCAVSGGKVCLMSGNFVQSGAPAVTDKSLRARAALENGANLVLELPLTASLSSAEGLARQGVEILSPFCDALSFGAEHPALVADMAGGMLAPGFDEALRRHLESGISYPAARQRALEALGYPAPERPNDILGAEYCKAILQTGSAMVPAPILRQGDYHGGLEDGENPSATALRQALSEGRDVGALLPSRSVLGNLHFMKYGEKAVLSRLRTMTDGEFEALPYGAEGLWRRLMHACRREDSLEDILAAVKTKRYTASRIQRMVMCAFLGITDEMLCKPAPYVRVLGFNETGREILKKARQTGVFLNAGAPAEGAYAALERRAADLYGLFAETPEPPGAEARRRVINL